MIKQFLMAYWRAECEEEFHHLYLLKDLENKSHYIQFEN